MAAVLASNGEVSVAGAENEMAVWRELWSEREQLARSFRALKANVMTLTFRE